jgi:dTDP-4-amino-4,6-dideoxygalactose transaminase
MVDTHQIERAEDPIPIGEPDLTELEQEAVLGVLRHGWLTRGAECMSFEEEFQGMVGADHALALNSCTAALHLALLVHGIRPGDEVILPSLTFAATGHVVVHCGAMPVFAEVDPETCCIDPSHVETLVTSRTRAILPVHYAGHPADMSRLRAIAEKHHLALIEDAAHALGASWEGGSIGAAGSTACFSFYSNKNITTAEGGMLTLPDPDLHECAVVLSLHGMSRDAWNRFGTEGAWRYQVTHFGYKYNANDLLAALGRAQLLRLPEMQEHRKKAWDFYQEMFGDDGRVQVPVERTGITHARHLYVLQLTGQSKANRDDVVTALRAKGIGATVHYDPLHLHPAYRERFGTREGMLPVTEQVAARIFSLPMHSKLTEQQVNRVSIEVLRFV